MNKVYVVIDQKNKEYLVSAIDQDKAKNMIEKLGSKVKVIYPKSYEKHDNR